MGMWRAQDGGVQGPDPHRQVIAEAAATAQQVGILEARKWPPNRR
jgi:hypothetical protein